MDRLQRVYQVTLLINLHSKDGICYFVHRRAALGLISRPQFGAGIHLLN